MIYNYKSNETVQDVILECYCLLMNDIADEYSTLRRDDSLFIYAPSYVAREILARLLDEIEDVWVHAESHNELLYNDENEVIITIGSDGMIFVESARGENGQLKDNDGGSLTYVYDGFSKRDIDELSASGESILVFGFEDEDMVCDEDNEDTGLTAKEDNSVATTSKESYRVNGKEVSKEEFDKKYAEFENKYIDNVRDMLLNYREFMDEMNEWAKLFRW